MSHLKDTITYSFVIMLSSSIVYERQVYSSLLGSSIVSFRVVCGFFPAGSFCSAIFVEVDIEILVTWILMPTTIMKCIQSISSMGPIVEVSLSREAQAATEASLLEDTQHLLL